jgi:hypothetical protein
MKYDERGEKLKFIVRYSYVLLQVMLFNTSIDVIRTNSKLVNVKRATNVFNKPTIIVGSENMNM